MNATQRRTNTAVPGKLLPLNWLAAALEWAGDVDALGRAWMLRRTLAELQRLCWSAATGPRQHFGILSR